jgi:hypothetical protein
VVLEELPFVLQGCRDALARLDIALTTIYDWHVAETKRNNSSRQNIDDVCALVPVA